MAHKTLNLAIPLVLILVCSISAFSQSDEQIAQVKFTLTDFKNPNEFLTRPALIRFSPDGKYLAVSGRTTDIIVYDLASGQIHSKIDGKGYNAFSFLPDGRTVLARDNDYHIRVFNIDDGKMLRELKGAAMSADDAVQTATGNTGILEMQPVDLSPDKSKVLAIKGSRTFGLLDFVSGDSIYDFRNPDKSRAGIMLLKAMYGFDRSFMAGLMTLKRDSSFSPDGRYALAANISRTATLWDIQTGKLAGQIGPLENTILNEAFSPDGKLLATTDSEGVSMVWNVPDGKLISTVGGKDDSNYIAAWSPNGDLIWTIAFKEDARAYDPLTGKLVRTLGDSKAWGVTYSPDGKLLLTRTIADKASFGSVWNAASGELVAKIPRNKGDEMPYVLMIDPTGRFIVSASKKDVKLWNLKGQLVKTLDNAVFPVKFNLDGTLLATGGKNDTGYVWQIGQN
jgi:WD40 repeat protein